MKSTEPIPPPVEDPVPAPVAVAEAVEPTAPIAPTPRIGTMVPATAPPRVVSGVSLAPTVRLRHYKRWRGWCAPKLF
jgi:hypothetical protein